MKKIFTVTILFLVVFSLLSCFAFASETDADVVNEEKNVFSTLYNELFLHSDKILSALAFISSLLLIFTYRKGMLPILKGGLSSLASSVSHLKDEAKKAGELSEEEIKRATEKLGKAEELLSSLSEKLESLTGELESTRDEQKKCSDIKIIMQYQIDMLYEVFMSSSLPLYQKEAIGEKISAMKSKLTNDLEDQKND